MGRWRLKEDQGNERWSSRARRHDRGRRRGVTLPPAARRRSRGSPADPSSARVWWSDAGVHQNITFPVHPDPISGMHCWHQKVRVRPAEPGDRTPTSTSTSSARAAVYRKWLGADAARHRRAAPADLAVPPGQAGARRLRAARRRAHAAGRASARERGGGATPDRLAELVDWSPAEVWGAAQLSSGPAAKSPPRIATLGRDALAGDHGRAGADPAGARLRGRRRACRRSAGSTPAALPPLAAALFASSPYLQTGPVALTSLLTFGALAGPRPGGQRRLRAARHAARADGRRRPAGCRPPARRLIAHLMSEPMLMGFMPAGARAHRRLAAARRARRARAVRRRVGGRAARAGRARAPAGVADRAARPPPRDEAAAAGARRPRRISSLHHRRDDARRAARGPARRGDRGRAARPPADAEGLFARYSVYSWTISSAYASSSRSRPRSIPPGGEAPSGASRPERVRDPSGRCG